MSSGRRKTLPPNAHLADTDQSQIPPIELESSSNVVVSPRAQATTPFQSDSEVEDPRPKKRGRDITIGMKVMKRQKEGRKIDGVVISPDTYVVVGPNEKIFKMEIGVITRSLAPFRVLHWKNVKEGMKTPLFERVESEFEIDLSDPHVKEVVDAAMAKSFRRFKHRCYKHYQKFPTPDVALKNPKTNVEESDWIALCEHFESEEFLNSSDANKKNRDNVQVQHTSGSKSFCQRVYEMQNSKDPPIEPVEIKVYHDIHQKDGNWIHPQAEENYEQMNNLHSTDNDEALTGRQIVQKVCMRPKSTYACGLGYGYKSNTTRRPVSQPRREDFGAELREALRVIESQREMIESQGIAIEGTKSSQERLEAKVQKLMHKNKKKYTLRKLKLQALAGGNAAT